MIKLKLKRKAVFPEFFETGILPKDYSKSQLLADLKLVEQLLGQGLDRPPNYAKANLLIVQEFGSFPNPALIEKLESEFIAERRI